MIFCFGGFGDNSRKIQWGFLREHYVCFDFYDESHQWYLRSIPRVLEDIEKHKDDKNYFLGVSMGGFGALLFSSLTGLGPALALSPQTNLEIPEHLDKSKQKQLKYIKDCEPKDLSKLPYQEGTVVVYPEKNKLDRFQGESMRVSQGVTTYGFPSKNHGWFKDDVPKEQFRGAVHRWLSSGEFCLEPKDG